MSARMSRPRDRMALLLSLFAVLCATLALTRRRTEPEPPLAPTATVPETSIDSIPASDHVARWQAAAFRDGRSSVAHWGTDPQQYGQSTAHSNRLIPVYAFGTKGAGSGVDLDDYLGARSVYRREEDVRRLYGRVPAGTVRPDAEFMDQTDVAAIQRAAVAAGKKYIFLVVFDGMDWETTRAAAIHAAGRVAYDSGRGTGLHFLDYGADGTTQFGWMVTSPDSTDLDVDLDAQTVRPSALAGQTLVRGGYDLARGGPNPWTKGSEPGYCLARPVPGESPPETHAVTDSSSSATSMTAGAKIYNGSVNVDRTGAPLTTVPHEMQAKGYSVGAVTSVPISHATPAAAYAHNVSRDDYQDLARDMLGLPSVAHPQPLSGLDVLIGGGYGVPTVPGSATLQGSNFVAGKEYVTDDDVRRADVRHGGKYVVVTRAAGVAGNDALQRAAQEARDRGQRLFGLFGLPKYKGHLPFRTADGDFRPVASRDRPAEVYAPNDLRENPTLAEMTTAALTVLSANPKGFWLMVEAGDVDWANHQNNLDDSIGAVLSGDAAVKVVTDWVELHGGWSESLLIVTADHGHHLVLTDPAGLLPPKSPRNATNARK